MEFLEHRLAVVLFTDGFTMPAPVVEFVQTLCHSESGLLLSNFAVATVALGLCLHARETFAAVKQFLDEVNSLSDRLSAIMDGDDDENADLIIPILLQSDENLSAKDAEKNLITSTHAPITGQSSDKSAAVLREMSISDSADHADSVIQELGTEQSFGAPKHKGPDVPHAARDPRRVANTSGNTAACEANRTANTPLEASGAQSTGNTKCPIEALEVLDYSETQPKLETPSALPSSSSTDLSISEMLGFQVDNAEPSSMVIRDELGARDVPVSTLAETLIEAFDSSVIAGQDKTFVESESLPGLKDRRSTFTNEAVPTNLDATDFAHKTNMNTHARQEAFEDIGQEQFRKSLGSLSSLALCDNEAEGCNESLSTRINDQTTRLESKSSGDIASSETRYSLTAASLRPSKSAEDAIMREPVGVPDSMAVNSKEIMKRGRRDSGGVTREVRGLSVSSRTPAYLPAPIRIAENMRRRALDLMEESHKLKDSSLCMIFEHMNPSYDVHSATGLVRLDLHNQPAEEAVMLTRLHLDFCRKACAERTEIITGRGRHSKGGVSVLRPVVGKELSRHPDVLISDTNPNPGSFIVAFARLEVIEGVN